MKKEFDRFDVERVARIISNYGYDPIAFFAAVTEELKRRAAKTGK